MRLRLERKFMAACERWGLTPSRWLPRLRMPKGGIYQKGTAYSWDDEGPEYVACDEPDCVMNHHDDRPHVETPYYLPFFSVYELLWTWSFERRNERLRLGCAPEDAPEPGFWENIWSFAHDVSMGLYDAETWRALNRQERS